MKHLLTNDSPKINFDLFLKLTSSENVKNVRKIIKCANNK